MYPWLFTLEPAEHPKHLFNQAVVKQLLQEPVLSLWPFLMTLEKATVSDMDLRGIRYWSVAPTSCVSASCGYGAVKWQFRAIPWSLSDRQRGLF